jgi:hypothetical protein
MKMFILAMAAAMTLGMGVASAAPSGFFNSLTNNHLPSAPYTYSTAGG